MIEWSNWPCKVCRYLKWLKNCKDLIAKLHVSKDFLLPTLAIFLQLVQRWLREEYTQISTDAEIQNCRLNWQIWWSKRESICPDYLISNTIFSQSDTHQYQLANRIFNPMALISQLSSLDFFWYWSDQIDPLWTPKTFLTSNARSKSLHQNQALFLLIPLHSQPFDHVNTQ